MVKKNPRTDPLEKAIRALHEAGAEQKPSLGLAGNPLRLHGVLDGLVTRMELPA